LLIISLNCNSSSSNREHDDQLAGALGIEAGLDQSGKAAGLFAPHPSGTLPSVPSQSSLLQAYASAAPTNASTNYVFNNSYEDAGLGHSVDAMENSPNHHALLYHYGNYDYSNLHARP
jgi:hypothetical protein